MDPHEENWLAAEMTIFEGETEDFSEGIRASVKSLISPESDHQRDADSSSHSS